MVQDDLKLKIAKNVGKYLQYNSAVISLLSSCRSTVFSSTQQE